MHAYNHFCWPTLNRLVGKAFSNDYFTLLLLYRLTNPFSVLLFSYANFISLRYALMHTNYTPYMKRERCVIKVAETELPRQDAIYSPAVILPVKYCKSLLSFQNRGVKREQRVYVYGRMKSDYLMKMLQTSSRRKSSARLLES